MKVEHRIPTILGILIIIVSLATTVFLFKNIRSFLGQATQDATPTEVKITNVSESSFTVSWITSGNLSGTISFGENSSLGKIATDDRDQISGTTSEYSTHHVTLRYLKPQTKYYLKIISGQETFDNNGEPYLVTTASEIGPSSSETNPAYGTVVKIDGSPAVGAIVYFNLLQSAPVSTLVKASGTWLVTLNSVRTADLSGFVKFSGAEKLEIFIQGGNEGMAQAITTVANDSPVPQITLGTNYDFLQEITPTPSPTSISTPSPAGGFEIPVAATPSPSLTSPASESAVPSDRPIFTGKGIPGKTVTIKIESPTPVTGTATVDQNGNWTWTPPSDLPPGDHTVTITTTDSAGNPIKLTRNFTVLASGTQVTEPATPSAIPTPKPSPTLKPTPPATSSTASVSGNLTPTILIFILGLTLLVVGFGKLLLLDKP